MDLFPVESDTLGTLIFENNEFLKGINFDWDVIKKAKLEVTEGADWAGRMLNMYSMLKSNLKRQNKLEDADECHYMARDYLRKNYWRDSDAGIFNRAFTTIFYYVDWLSTGYGTQPLRVFPFAFCVILIFAVLYFIKPDYISDLHKTIDYKKIVQEKLGKLTAEELQLKFPEIFVEEVIPEDQLLEKIASELSEMEIIKLVIPSFIKNKSDEFWNCIYFSFCAFITSGVVKYYPRKSVTKFLVMAEGALGLICLGLFIASYVNLLLR
jgi:hypothetical protein